MPPWWTYQTYVDNASGRAFNADFVINPTSRFARKIVIRIQTEQYHNFATPKVYAFDRAQRAGVGRFNDVIDISDDQFLWDTSGRAIMWLMRRAMAGVDPKQIARNRTGHQRRSRSAR